MATFTAPAAFAGVTTVIKVELLKFTKVALLPPNDTVAPLTKLLPVMVTKVPPASGPLVGVILTIVGGEINVNALNATADCESGF